MRKEICVLPRCLGKAIFVLPGIEQPNCLGQYDSQLKSMILCLDTVDLREQVLEQLSVII